jgi:hypothetical protein
MHKKIIYILSLIFFITSCNTVDSVKRGITGAKRDTADEFLIKKKDPLILPPDYENLPTPDERDTAKDEIAIFENSLDNLEEEGTSGSSSVENSIMKKIQSK